MGELGGFIKLERVVAPKRDPQERVKDFTEIWGVPDNAELQRQGARCMDCGVPFCHEACPLGNLIPDWNDLVYRDSWRDALDQLHATNNFPEFTGRICPAPCESACVLEINDDPVTIKQIEQAIVDRGFEEGWIVADPPTKRTGYSVAVIGSGAAGMAAAAELNKRGHKVTVFERDEGVGGLMRFGVPDPKLEKWRIDRRADLLAAEGIEWRCGVDVGTDITGRELRDEYDSVVIAIGSRVHRDIEIPGRSLRGVHFAMDYLYERNRAVARLEGRTAPPAPSPEREITAKDKHVIVIGGGDTGMDCIANAEREGAASAVLLDTYNEDATLRPRDAGIWPGSPKREPSTYALDEGGERRWSHAVTELVGDDQGRVAGVRGHQVGPPRDFEPVPGSEYEHPAQLVLLAIGFTGPEREGAIDQLSVDLDARGNVIAPAYETSADGVFACGDARRGQSLIVWAINEGRECADAVDGYLSRLAPRDGSAPLAASGS